METIWLRLSVTVRLLLKEKRHSGEWRSLGRRGSESNDVGTN
jgi:hypothetical protein